MIMMNCFFGMVDRRKTFNLIYSRDQILTIASLRYAVSRVWACAKHEFKHSWMKLRSSDNHYIIFVNQRSSRLEVFCKKGVIRNFTKFTGKHLCQSLFFNKIAGLRVLGLRRQVRLWHRCFPVNFVKFLRTAF